MPSLIPAPPPFASATKAGLVSTGTQTFAGAKTFSGQISMTGDNPLQFSLISTGDLPDPTTCPGALAFDGDTVTLKYSDGVDWVELGTTGGSITGGGTAGYVTFWDDVSNITGSTNLFWDDFNGFLGIGIAVPTVALDVVGAIKASTTIAATGNVTGANLSGTNTGNVTLTAFGSSPAAAGASLSGQILTLQPADATNPGGVTTGTQTFAGAKTFSGAMAITSTSTAALAVDTNVLLVDGTNNRVGINKTSPAEALDVVGSIRFTTSLMPLGSAGSANQALFSQGAGQPPAWVTAPSGNGQAGKVAIWTGTNTLSVDTELQYDATNNRFVIGHNGAATHNLELRGDAYFECLTAGAVPALQINKDISTTLGNSILLLGGTGHGFSDSMWGIGFGYTGGVGTSTPPAEFGFVNTENVGNGKGDFYWATRDVTTNTLPTERMRLKANGDLAVNTDTFYVDVTNDNVGIGDTPDADQKLHVFGGNLKIEGIDDEASIRLQRTETISGSVNPEFKIGGIRAGGVNLPMLSISITDNTYTDKDCFLIESSGTVASVSDGDRRSHYEAFLELGHVDPVFRLNSSPYMTFELGPGGGLAAAGDVVRSSNVTTVVVDAPHGLTVGSQFHFSNDEADFTAIVPPSVGTVASIISAYSFTYADPGPDAVSTIDHFYTGITDIHFKRSDAFTAQLALGGTARTTWYPGAFVCEANVDFYVSNGANPLVWASAGYNRVSMGAPVPGAKLHVQGTAVGELVTIFQSPASHANNITEWWDPSNVAVAAITKEGGGIFGARNVYKGTSGITAFATGGQASATALTAEVNFVTTVASGGDSVKLPVAALGGRVVVFNDGANALDIFPVSGSEIDSLGANNAYSLASGASREFWGKSATAWRSR